MYIINYKHRYVCITYTYDGLYLSENGKALFISHIFIFGIFVKLIYRFMIIFFAILSSFYIEIYLMDFEKFPGRKNIYCEID